MSRAWGRLRHLGGLLLDECERAVPWLRRLRRKPGVFCMLPWVHMNVAQDGKVYPCCMSPYASHDVPPLGDLRESTLKEVWNSEGLRGLRRNMLEGVPSPACEGCYELERSGLRSFRRRSNKAFARHFGRVLSTAPDGDAGELSMPYMDIRFSNVCNFRCRTCGPYASSSWHEEGKRLPGFTPPAKHLTPTKDPEDLWRQLEPLLPDLQEVYFAGGEPLLMEEHYRILEFLIRRRMFGVRLTYSTNFSVLDHGGRDLLRMWNSFERVTVGASLDGMGARGEYLRKGQDWPRVVENRRRMMRDAPRARFRLTPTLSALNALHLPDFHRAWVDEGLVAPGAMELNVLLNPLEYRVQVLPLALKRLVQEKFQAHVDGVLKPGGWRTLPLRGAISGAMEFMLSQDLTGHLDRFRTRLRRVDGWRSEDFAAVFPELAELNRP